MLGLARRARWHSLERRRSWNDLFAARTRAGVGAGLADILALAGDTTLIPFAGGFPDAQTFPGAAAATLLAELVAVGDASALQYAPTQGLPGPRTSSPTASMPTGGWPMTR